MVPPPGHGPQRGASILWISSQVLPLDGMPLDLPPKPRDCQGAAVRGRGHPGPQGKLEATRDETHQCGLLSTKVQ